MDKAKASSTEYRRKLRELLNEAIECNECFKDTNLKRALIDRPNPCFVGDRYGEHEPRILVLLLNPGSGKRRASRGDTADEHLKNLLHEFAGKKNDDLQAQLVFDKIQKHKEQDLSKWGGGGVSWFFFEQLGLCFPEIALGNVAWCSTEGNKHPHEILNHCFELHTIHLVKILWPNIVLLAGKDLHWLAGKVSEVSGARVVTLSHYSYYYRKQLSLDQTDFPEVCRRLKACVLTYQAGRATDIGSRA